MSLALRNRFTDLESPYVTFMSGEHTGDINLEDINLDIESSGQREEEVEEQVERMRTGS